MSISLENYRDGDRADGLLRRVFLANAVFSTISASAFVAAPAPLAAFLGFSEPGLLIWLGGMLLVFAAYVALYSVGRFWIEALRVDPANHVLGLRLNLWTSLLVFAAAVGYLWVSARRRPGRETTVYRAGAEASDAGDAGTATVLGDGASGDAGSDVGASGDAGSDVGASGDGTVPARDAPTDGGDDTESAGTVAGSGDNSRRDAPDH